MSTLDFMLDALRNAVANGEATVDDVVARLAGAADETAAPPQYPTVRDHVAAVSRTLAEDSRRTWATHWRRLEDGTPEFCGCDCDACLDLEAGCGCGCRGCADRVAIPASADLALRPQAVRASDVELWATVAERMARKRAVAANKRRAARGLVAKPAHGTGGRENAVTAYRHLFDRLVDDELWDRNPAQRVRKPRRNDTVRRALRDDEIGPYFDAVVAGGDDPELDFHLAWFHFETGARRQGGVSLTVGDLKRGTQAIRLREKNKKDVDQPASAELIDALEAFAVRRGGAHCDRQAPDYDPAAPVFHYRDLREGEPWPLTERRYDTLYRRIQTTLPWAGEIMRTNHCLRKTGASIVERIAGTRWRACTYATADGRSPTPTPRRTRSASSRRSRPSPAARFPPSRHRRNPLRGRRDLMLRRQTLHPLSYAGAPWR